MHDMMSVILEDVLDEELGYSKYDYRNKDTDNSRNGYSKKTMHTSYGDMDVAIPRNRNGEYELQLIKKYPNTVKKDMGKNAFHGTHTILRIAQGMTSGNIESHMKELHDMDISDSTGQSTGKILPNWTFISQLLL